MDIILGLGFLVIVSVIGYLFYYVVSGGPERDKRNNEEGKRKHDSKLAQIFNENSLNVTQVYRDTFLSVIGIDESSKKVVFLKSSFDTNFYGTYGKRTDGIKYNIDIYNYADILETEIIEDGHTITKTSRSSQIGSALLGGVLAGSTGAIIGGLSGKKKSKKEVEKVFLQVIVNNTNEPIQRFILLNSEIRPAARDSKAYKESHEEAMRINSTFKVIINEADKMQQQVKEIPGQVIATNTDKTKEIRDLYALLNEGIITKEEFASEKAKIFNQ